MSVPVSATARLTPVIPTSRLQEALPQHPARVGDERLRVVGVERPARLALEQLGDLAGVEVDRRREQVRRPVAERLHDVLAQVGLDRVDARRGKRVVEPDLLGQHRLGLHGAGGAALVGRSPPPARRPRPRCPRGGRGRRPRSRGPRARRSARAGVQWRRRGSPGHARAAPPSPWSRARARAGPPSCPRRRGDWRSPLGAVRLAGSWITRGVTAGPRARAGRRGGARAGRSPRRRARPSRCIRQPDVGGDDRLGPAARARSSFSSAIATDTSGSLIANVPPKPQQRSAFSVSTIRQPSTPPRSESGGSAEFRPRSMWHSWW